MNFGIFGILAGDQSHRDFNLQTSFSYVGFARLSQYSVLHGIPQSYWRRQSDAFGTSEFRIHIRLSRLNCIMVDMRLDISFV